MPSVAHKQILDIPNTTEGSNASFRAMWSAVQAMLAAGWTLAGSSDGTSKSTSTDPAALLWRNAPGTIGTSTTSGSGAVVAAPERGRALVTGLLGMTATMKGSYLKITGSSVAANNNHHQIAEFVSPTSVRINALQFAVAADPVGRSWDVRNGLTESYPAALTSVSAWVCLIGPHTLYVPITAPPSGRFLRGERIIQAGTGFEGELRDVVWNTSSLSGYLTVLGQVRGTGLGAYGLETGGLFTGQSTGYTVTQVGSAREFRLESVIWKAADALAGSRFTGMFEVGVETRFSDLVASAGCTATVAPGGGGVGNTFPTYAWVAWGLDSSPGVQNWGNFNALRNTQNSFAICADAIEERGYSADGSWTCGTLARYGFYWSIQGDHITEGGDYGDLAPWVSVTLPTATVETHAGIAIDRLAVTAAANTSALTASPMFESPSNAYPVANASFLRGWRRRGLGGARDEFIQLVRAFPSIAQTQQPITDPAGNDTVAGEGILLSATHDDQTRVLIPLSVGAYKSSTIDVGLPPVAYHKGDLRWIRVVMGGMTNDGLDQGTFLQLATAHSSLCAGPFSGVMPTISVARLYLIGLIGGNYLYQTHSEVFPDGSLLTPGGAIPVDPGSTNWYPAAGNTRPSEGPLSRLPLTPYTLQGTGVIGTGSSNNLQLAAAPVGTRSVARFWTAPLATQTISGTIKGQCRCSESNLAADMYTAARVYVVTPAGAIRGVLRELLTNADTAGGLELPTTVGNRKLFRNDTLTPVNVIGGDRIVLELGFRVGVATHTGLYSVANGAPTDLAEGDAIEATVRNSWIEFSNPLLFSNTTSTISITSGAGSSGAGVVVESGETTPPILGVSTPVSGSALARAGSVSIPISDNVEVARVIASVTYATASIPEIIYDGAVFSGPYVANSSLIGSLTNKTLVVRRDDPGWLDSPTVKVTAIDSFGNSTTQSYSFTVTGYPFAPAITNLSPSDGDVTPGETISFDVIAEDGLASSVVLARFPDIGAYEVVWDGAEFADEYAAQSVTAVIANGRHFECRRANGWPVGVTFKTVSVNVWGKVG